MSTYKIQTTQKGQQITIKSVLYNICAVSQHSLYLRRNNGDVVYRSGYFTKNGQSYATGLPKTESLPRKWRNKKLAA